jgi:hypothetical protein
MHVRFHGLGLFVALLALACQLAIGASVPPTAGSIAPFAVICHADSSRGVPTVPSHRGPDCQFCPLCAAFAAPAPTLLSGLSVPPRRPAHLVHATPVARAAIAPAPSLLSAHPRGPPAAA